MSSLLSRVIAWVTGFVTENMPQSSARLIALLATLTACVGVLGTVAFAFAHPDQALTVTALGGTTVMSVVTLAGYALKVRTPNDPANLPGASP